MTTLAEFGRSETADGIEPRHADLAGDLRAIRRLLEAACRPPAVLLERKDFATLLSVGATTLDTMRAAGKVGPAEVKVGGGVRWHRPEVEAWLLHRGPNGDLHDAATWPAVWRQLQKRAGGM